MELKEKDKADSIEEKKSKESMLVKFKKMDTKRKIQYAVILLITIVILAIFFGSTGKDGEPEAKANTSVQTYESNSLEEQLRQTLSKIEGAGEVEVMITYESSAILNPAISVDTQSTTSTDEFENGNSTTNSTNTQREVVTVSGSDGNEALVLSEQNPEIKGVIVIAQGADNIVVKLSLLSAVETVLDVDPDKVDVYKMNKE